MRKIDKIIIHCSASLFGDASIIREWHTEPPRNWSDIGYHYIILNGYVKSSKKYIPEKDGIIEKGRSDEIVGAHCRKQNSNSIGICLIGNNKFTTNQQLSLIDLVLKLMDMYNLTHKDVYGHYEFDSHKACPCFDMDRFREMLEKKVCLNMKEFVEEL